MKAYDLGAKAIIFSQFVNMLDVSHQTLSSSFSYTNSYHRSRLISPTAPYTSLYYANPNPYYTLHMPLSTLLLSVSCWSIDCRGEASSARSYSDT
jgi:hypothetical protein